MIYITLNISILVIDSDMLNWARSQGNWWFQQWFVLVSTNSSEFIWWLLFSRLSVVQRRKEEENREAYIYLFIRHRQIQNDWRRPSIRNENMMHKYWVLRCECISSCQPPSPLCHSHCCYLTIWSINQTLGETENLESTDLNELNWSTTNCLFWWMFFSTPYVALDIVLIFAR